MKQHLGHRKVVGSNGTMPKKHLAECLACSYMLITIAATTATVLCSSGGHSYLSYVQSFSSERKTITSSQHLVSQKRAISLIASHAVRGQEKFECVNSGKSYHLLLHLSAGSQLRVPTRITWKILRNTYTCPIH